MFKDMAADTYLASAGIADDWPYGRGCWQSDDKQCIVWFGEEDQLRIMCMKRGTKLNEVFDRLKKMLDTIEFVAGAESKLPCTTRLCSELFPPQVHRWHRFCNLIEVRLRH